MFRNIIADPLFRHSLPDTETMSQNCSEIFQIILFKHKNKRYQMLTLLDLSYVQVLQNWMQNMETIKMKSSLGRYLASELKIKQYGAEICQPQPNLS